MVGHCGWPCATPKRLGISRCAWLSARRPRAGRQSAGLVPIPALAEIQITLKTRFEQVQPSLKLRAGNGSCASTVRPHRQTATGTAPTNPVRCRRLSQSAPCVIGKSATIAAQNGYRFRVPTARCFASLTNRLHGELTTARRWRSDFYKTQVARHLIDWYSGDWNNCAICR